MKASESTINARKRHHDALKALAASLGVYAEGLDLWRKLHRIEVKAHRATTAYCNGEMGEAGIDLECERATDAVRRVFGGKLPPGFHINRDPRGHALKLMASDDGCVSATPFALESDWGRNQILAPEIF